MAKVNPPSELRGSPSPRYNCHGLVFASRRTNIHDTRLVFQVLTEDDYKEISSIQDVRAGDVAIYFASNGDPEHSAIVTFVPTATPIVPTVVSKWGSNAEVIHPVFDCPYAVADIRYYRVST